MSDRQDGYLLDFFRTTARHGLADADQDRRALAAASSADPVERAGGLTYTTALRLGREDHTAAADRMHLARRLLSGVDRSEHAILHWWAGHVLAKLAFDNMEFEAAEESFDRCWRLAGEFGLNDQLVQSMAGCAIVRFERGMTEDACDGLLLALAEVGLGETPFRSPPPIVVRSLANALDWFWLHDMANLVRSRAAMQPNLIELTWQGHPPGQGTQAHGSASHARARRSELNLVFATCGVAQASGDAATVLRTLSGHDLAGRSVSSDAALYRLLAASYRGVGQWQPAIQNIEALAQLELLKTPSAVECARIENRLREIGLIPHSSDRLNETAEVVAREIAQTAQDMQEIALQLRSSLARLSLIENLFGSQISARTIQVIRHSLDDVSRSVSEIDHPDPAVAC